MFASAYSEKERVRFECVGKSLTKQSMSAECDINNIMKKYQKTGAISHTARHGGDYGFASSDSFHESMLIVVKAQEMFEDLPSSLRSRFGNDPGNLLDFVQDDDNLEEMVKLGLVERTPKAANEEVEVDPPGKLVVEPEGDQVASEDA